MHLWRFHFVLAKTPHFFFSFSEELQEEGRELCPLLVFGSVSLMLKRAKLPVLIFLPWQQNVMNPITLLTT